MTKEQFETWRKQWLVAKHSGIIYFSELPEDLPQLQIGASLYLIFDDGIAVFSTYESEFFMGEPKDDAFAWSQFLMLRDNLAEFIAKFDDVNLRRVRGW